MSIFKCKMCGGALEVSEGMTVCECEFCGTTQTIPKTRDDVAANLFNRANNLRSKCEFDKAQEIYEKIVNSDPNEAEAYWGIVLCKYGIEYVEDPSTFKKVPTCHRTQLESVQSDVDYQSALEHADSIQRDIYEKEAAEIDRLQKDILAIVRNEKPFDVFICYKETDDAGKRTQDSVIANDIYHQLTQEGFKVFYAAITLEDKLGQEYEPYIFAALNSAKVMLTIGTKPEYFNAVWVKNEWSRFLKIAQSDRSKLLIPCYKDMDAYDLPEEFSHLQAQDMGKIGFINDIIRGIKKVLTKPEEKTEKTVVVSSSSSANVENLLKRGMFCLEDKKWKDANEFFEQVLNENAEEPRAYLGKLLADCKVSSEDGLNYIEEDIGENNFFQKAVRFADEEFKNKLENYRKQGIYNKAVSIASAGTSDKYKEAIELFESLNEFKDSDEQIEICKNGINENIYQSAIKEYKENHIENIEKAIKTFESIIDYKDSAQIIEKCNDKIKEIKYSSAKQNYNSDSIEKIIMAERIFREIIEYKDSAKMIERCREKHHELEEAAKEEKRIDEELKRLAEEQAIKKEKMRKTFAIAIVAAIIVIILSIILLNKLYVEPKNVYDNATRLYESGQYREAIAKYESIIGFSDSAEQVQKVKNAIYANAGNLMISGNFEEAIEEFKYLGDFMDSAEKLTDSHTGLAISQAKNGQFYDAYHTCLDNNLPFENMMKDNGLGDKYNEYYNKFKSYAGKYFQEYRGELDYDVYIDVTINEDDWTFSIVKTYDLDEKHVYDIGQYDFSFDKREKYDSIYGYDFETEGFIIDNMVENCPFTFVKAN